MINTNATRPTSSAGYTAPSVAGLQNAPTAMARSLPSIPVPPSNWAIAQASMLRRQVNPLGPGISTRPMRLIPAFWQQFPTGENNAITDVPGIKVGQVSVSRDLPSKIRTGVTAIVPDASLLTGGAGNLATTGFRAAAVNLNGNGELTGRGPLETAGILNSPILLTNTYSVGAAHQGVFNYFARHHPGQWTGQLPVVGECWDGFYNTIENPVLTPEDTVAALEAAKSGPLAQGRVGAGTGMRSFGLHAGIGSASRKVWLNGRQYTIGILVNANHSKLNNLNPMLRSVLENQLHIPLEQLQQSDDRDHAVRPPLPSPRQGSIMTTIATDLPLDSKTLHQLAERAGLGIGNTGSIMATTSGDYAVAFSTANPMPVGDGASPINVSTSVHPDALSPIFQATIEAVTEAQLNAIVAAHTR